jgi:hypothetical protein
MAGQFLGALLLTWLLSRLANWALARATEGDVVFYVSSASVALLCISVAKMPMSEATLTYLPASMVWLGRDLYVSRTKYGLAWPQAEQGIAFCAACGASLSPSEREASVARRERAWLCRECRTRAEPATLRAGSRAFIRKFTDSDIARIRTELRQAWRLLVVVLVAGALVLFAYSVWPTPYRFENTTIGQVGYFVRTHRITGEVEYLSPQSGEWRRFGSR